ncbi:ferrous iron transport protein A [Streptomyces yangpuensis]|uniref:FeoA family protein n=1 Tax=Streptomyces yangpuensis TaxID=1648182 RepID=UPI003694A0F7
MSGSDGVFDEARGPGISVIDALPLCLADLIPGARAVVIAVVADGEPTVVRRLHDLGFTPGAVVEVVRRAPLRDPVLYRVKDYEVCLRRAQAACVHIAEATR